MGIFSELLGDVGGMWSQGVAKGILEDIALKRQIATAVGMQKATLPGELEKVTAVGKLTAEREAAKREAGKRDIMEILDKVRGGGLPGTVGVPTPPGAPPGASPSREVTVPREETWAGYPVPEPTAFGGYTRRQLAELPPETSMPIMDEEALGRYEAAVKSGTMTKKTRPGAYFPPEDIGLKSVGATIPAVQLPDYPSTYAYTPEVLAAMRAASSASKPQYPPEGSDRPGTVTLPERLGSVVPPAPPVGTAIKAAAPTVGEMLQWSLHYGPEGPGLTIHPPTPKTLDTTLRVSAADVGYYVQAAELVERPLKQAESIDRIVRDPEISRLATNLRTLEDLARRFPQGGESTAIRYMQEDMKSKGASALEISDATILKIEEIAARRGAAGAFGGAWGGTEASPERFRERFFPGITLPSNQVPPGVRPIPPPVSSPGTRSTGPPPVAATLVPGAGGTSEEPAIARKARIQTTAEEQAKLGQKTLSAEQNAKVGLYNVLLHNMDTIERTLRPEYLGKGFEALEDFKSFKKWYNDIEAKVPYGSRKNELIPGAFAGWVRTTTGKASPEEVTFRMAVVDSSNILLYARSGAQINEEEYQRLKNALFKMFDEPTSFVAHLNYARELTRTLQSEIRRGTYTPAKTLEEEAGKKTPPPRFQEKTGGAAELKPREQNEAVWRDKTDGKYYVKRNGKPVEVSKP